MVERYYKLIHRAYFIITTKILNINKDIALQMAFKAINNIVGLNGIVLTLLVYSASPRIIEYNALSPTITQRTIALRKVIAEI
jgi:predicted ATP-grasp superfamily ATP-dependent carboligase